MKTKRLISMFLCIVMLGSLFTVGSFAKEDPEWAIDDGKHPQAQLQAELPARYDLRDEGLVTPVKLQDPWGSCWAFAGISMAETSILSAYGTTYAETKLDLSERHLAYFAMLPVTEAVEPAQAGEGLRPFDTSPNAPFNTGGIPIIISTLFSQGTGPLPEALFPYRGVNAIMRLQYFDEHTDEVLGKEIERWAAISGETPEEYLQSLDESRHFTREETMEYLRNYLRNRYEAKPMYSEHDDWSIPETNESGQPNRLINAGVVLKDGNVLPKYWSEGAAAPNADSIRAMKQELVNGRSVLIACKMERSGKYTMTSDEGGSEYNSYIDEFLEPDHAVCVVGYDDTYAAENFKIAPPGDGAWIVKNSWGSTAEDTVDDLGNPVNRNEYGVKNAAGEYTGYFYLSYYDRNIGQAETLAFSANLGDENGFYVLQHDYMPAIDDFFTSVPTEDVASSANVFTAEEAMELKSVSTRTSEENMRVTFAIYALGDDAKDPTDGEMLYRSSCNFEHAGFHRLDLEQPITVEKNQKFSVVSTASVLTAEGKRMYGIAANMAMGQELARTSGYTAYGKAVVNKGESFAYEDGEWRDWKDVTAENNYGFEIDNFSIKVYGVPVKPESEYLPGDLNHDGYVNAKDVTFLRRALAGGYGVELS